MHMPFTVPNFMFLSRENDWNYMLLQPPAAAASSGFAVSE
jgi:hypothetical protein